MRAKRVTAGQHISRTEPMRLHKGVLINWLRLHPEDFREIARDWDGDCASYIAALEAIVVCRRRTAMSIEMPELGEVWIKPSCPLPTLAEVLEVSGNTITVKYGRRPYSLSVDLFIGQGFKRHEMRTGIAKALAERRMEG